MLIRQVSLVACLCWASLTTYGQANGAGAGYVFELPGPTIAGAHFQGFGYNANPFNAVFDGLGPTSASQVLALPDGSKFYMLGAGGGGLESIDPTFTTFRSINGIAGTACAIALTPNGKYLLIASALTCPSANSTGTTSLLYVLDTSNDSVLSNNVTLTGVVQGFAISQDSKTAWILGNSAFGSSVIAMSMSTRAAIGQPFGLPFGGATSITLSPLGLLYVTEVNRIYEINPANLQITSNGEIPIVATPGSLRFTSDGLTAYVVNSTPGLGGVSLIQLNVTTHQVNTWPVFNSGVTPPVFDDVYPVGGSKVYAFSSVNTTFWDITPSPLSAAPSTSFGGTFPTSNVLSVAFSNELPAARYFYALIGNGNQTQLERINLATNTLDQQTLAILGPGILKFVAVPPQTGAAAFVQYNNVSQTLQPGATSTPLTVIVTDGTGRPVFNVPVTYSAADPNSGLVINGGAQTTNANGYATATATVPTTPASYVVNVSAGSATASFTLIISGTTGPGGGPTGGPTQVSIVAGNGDLLQAFSPSPTTQPLTIRVTDTNGGPLVNTPVTFSIVSGPGNIDVLNTTTDTNGLAATDFFAQQPQQGVPYQATDVNASTGVGGVDFVETTYVLNLDGTGQPQVNLVTPSGDAGYTVEAGEGDVVTNAITASIYTSGAITGQSVPIPNISIRIADQFDNTQPGPAACLGSTLSNNLGIAHCDLIAVCQVGVTLPRIYGMQVVIGENRVFPALLKVKSGSTRALSILAGNNQTGRGGQILPVDLTAIVNDSCSTPIPGAAVTWAVTQGDAKLSNLVTVSDGGGRVSARVTLGQTPGPVQITVAIGAAQQVFNIVNQVVVNSLTLISGGGQTGFINQTVAQPLTFQLKDINNNPVPNVQVSFTVTGNGAVNPTTGTTNTQGQVSTTITAGSTPSTVTVTASYAGFTASATATIKLPGPQIVASSFQNAASFAPGMVPCGLTSVIGPGLAPNVSGAQFGNLLGIGPLPLSLAGVSITVNGVPAPIYNVVNQGGTQEVTFQTPCETLANTTATVVVTVNGTPTTVTNVQVSTVQPGVFNGFVLSAADGSYVTASNPAKRGGTYYMVATGMGQANPPILTNSSGLPNQNLPAQSVIVGVANYGVTVNSAQYLQGSIGLYLVSFTIPTTLAQGGTTIPFPVGNNVPLALGQVVNGVTIFSAPSSLAAVQ